MIGSRAYQGLDFGIVQNAAKVLDGRRSRSGDILELGRAAFGSMAVDVAYILDDDIRLASELQCQVLASTEPHHSDDDP